MKIEIKSTQNRDEMIIDRYKELSHLSEEKRDKDILDLFVFYSMLTVIDNSNYSIAKALKKDREENTMTFINIPLTIKFESKPIKVVDDKIISDNKIIVRYSGCKKKRLDIDEAIKYIDECIADYNNSIEQIKKQNKLTPSKPIRWGFL